MDRQAEGRADSGRTVSAFALQVTLGCAMYSMVCVMTLQRQPNWFYPGAFLVFSPVLFAVNSLFLRKSRSMRSVVILNLLLCLAAFGSLWALGDLRDWAEIAFAGLFCIWFTVQGARRSLTPVTLREVLLSVDASALGLLLLLGVLSASGASLRLGLPMAVGCASALLALLTLRLNRPMGLREWLLVLLGFGGISLAVWLLVAVAAEPAGQGLVNLWHALTALAREAVRLLVRLLTFLFSLLPDGELEIEPAEVPDLQGEQEEAPLQANPVAEAVVLVLLVALAVTALVFLFRWLARMRVGGRESGRTGTTGPDRKRPSLGGALCRLWGGWMTALRQRVWLRRHRNTPAGLYYILVRRCARSPWRRRRWETPRGFLERLRESARGDPALTEAMDVFIPAAERALFAPSPGEETVPGAGLIRRRMGGAVRRQALRDLRDRLGQRLTSRGHAAEEPA